MTSLTNTQNQLLDLLSSALFSKSINLPADTDWKSLYDEALSQSVLPLAYSAAEKLLPKEDKKLWKQKASLIMGKSMNVSYEHTELHELMTAHNIPYVSIKGLSSAIYYPQPMLRTFGDVDFLIRPEDMDRTEKLILEQGFEEDKFDTSSHHLSYCKKAIDGKFSSHWEMHQSLNGIPQNDIGEIIETYLSDIIDTSIEYDEGNGIVRIPNNFYHGLIVLLHTIQHLTKNGIGLRHICDWVVFADYFEDDEFVNIFEKKLKDVGLWNFAKLLTLVGTKYLGCPSHAWAGEATDELLESMVCDICNGGEFGIKDSQREYQARYIANYNDQLIDDKKIKRQIWSMFDTKTRTICPIVNKVPVLLPFAYLYIAILYTIRVIIGKSRIDDKKILNAAEKRKQLYNSFNLYVPER